MKRNNEKKKAKGRKLSCFTKKKILLDKLIIAKAKNNQNRFRV
jgi:hypothetical protein